MQFEHIHFIINPAAGQPKPILHTLNEVLYPRDIEWSLSVTRGDGSGKQQAQAAVEAGADLVVVYGGDGTVKDVMNGLIGGHVPLAVLQGGTGNAMAYELGIPNDLAEAALLIIGEHDLRCVDVGKVVTENQPEDPGYFMLRASVGMQTEILEAATRGLKDRFGNLAYVLASLHTLTDSKPVTFHLTVDDQDISVEGLMCLVTNSASIGGPKSFRFAGEVDPSDGVLDVFVIDAGFKSIIERVLGTNPEAFAQRWAARSTITVRTPAPLRVTLDGEAFGETPVIISIIPQTVNVLVPRSVE